MLSRPLASVGYSDVNSSRMSDSHITMLLRVFEVAGVGRSEIGGRT